MKIKISREGAVRTTSKEILKQPEAQRQLSMAERLFGIKPFKWTPGRVRNADLKRREIENDER